MVGLQVSGKLSDKEQTLEEEIQLRERIQLQCKQAERMVEDLKMELHTTNQARDELAKQVKVAQVRSRVSTHPPQIPQKTSTKSPRPSGSSLRCSCAWLCVEDPKQLPSEPDRREVLVAKVKLVFTKVPLSHRRRCWTWRAIWRSFMTASRDGPPSTRGPSSRFSPGS